MKKQSALVLQEVGARTATIEEEFQASMCDNTQFQELLIKRGLDFKSLPIIKNVCFILNELAAKSGITILKKDVIDILIDCTKILSKQPSLQEFILKEKKRLFKEGKSKESIQRISTEKFKKQYNSIINVQNYVVISARLLITLQTSIPPYARTSKDTLCAFSGFDGNNGVDYFVCLLNTIYKSGEFSLRGNNKKDVILKKKLLKEMNELKKNKNINDLYEKYQKFTIQKEKILNKLDLSDDKKHVFKNYDEIKKEELMSIKDKRKINNRLYNISQTIKDDIETVIKKSPINDIITKAVENSCCTESIDGYKGYYAFISEVLGKTEIYDLFKESNYLYKYLDNFIIDRGTITRLYLSNNKNLCIPNQPVFSGPETDDREIIKDKFLIYVGEGDFKGEERNFVGNKNNKKLFVDLKTGKSYQEIKDKQYSEEEFINLLESIANKNHNVYKKYLTLMQKDKEFFQKIKQSSEMNLNNKIEDLVNKLNILCKKQEDNNFKKKYINLIKSIGIKKKDITYRFRRYQKINRDEFI